MDFNKCMATIFWQPSLVGLHFLFKKITTETRRHGVFIVFLCDSVSLCLCGEKYLKKCQLLLGINER